MEDYMIEFCKAYGKLHCDVCKKCVLSYSHHDDKFLCPECKKFVDEQTDKLGESIAAEIDQEVMIEFGMMDPKDAIDYRKKFKEELSHTCDKKRNLDN